MDIAQTLEYIEFFHDPKKAVILEANHGVGKSTIIHTLVRDVIARRHGVAVEDVGVIEKRASLMGDTVDFTGAIFNIGGRTFNAPPAWLPAHEDFVADMIEPLRQNGIQWTDFSPKPVYIIFLDEINMGNPVTQRAFMEFLLDRRCNGVPVRDDVYIFGAMNGNSQLYDVNILGPALSDRAVRIKFNPSYAEFFEYINKGVTAGKVHTSIPYFLKKYQDTMIDPSDDLIEKANNEGGEKLFSRRSWEALGTELQHYENRTGNSLAKLTASDDGIRLLKDVCSGHVGHAAGTTFVEYVRSEFKILSPEQIIEGLDQEGLGMLKAMANLQTGNLSGLSGLAGSVVDKMLDKYPKGLPDDIAENIYLFLRAVPNEIRSGCCKTWASKGRESFAKWTKTPERQYLTVTCAMTGDQLEKWKERYIAEQGYTGDFGISEDPYKAMGKRAKKK